jgi:RHS repeat-associated protein
LLGRPFQINSKEGTTTIKYDTAAHGVGNIQQATSPDGIITVFRYDTISRLSSEETQVDQQSYVFNYCYDRVGRLRKIQYPAVESPASPISVSFDYTPYGAIRAVNDLTSGSPTQIWQNTARNSFNEITVDEFANGAATTRQFDLRGRLTSLSTTFDGKPVQDLSYQYDGSGNLTTQTDRLHHVVESYHFDPLDRLRRWDVNKNDNGDLMQQFDYDDIGNVKSRTTLFGSGENLIYRYSGVHAGPHAVTSINNSIYTYDAAGRERTAPGRRSTYLSWGLPFRIEGKNFTDRFRYDFQQQRVLKTRSDGTRVVTLEGLFEQVSKRNGRATNVYYIPGLGRIVAQRLQQRTGGKVEVYLHGDRLGSIAATTTEQSRNPEVRAYDPFGTTRKAADPSRPALPFSSENLGFTERESDLGVGLLNMLGRLYDPRIGRFVSPDPLISNPLSSQRYNPYSYVDNNPLRWTDPTGLQVEGGTLYAVGYGPPSQPWEWNPYIPPLSAPPLLSGLDSPPTPPPLVSAGISDDTGLTPPPPVPVYDGPSISVQRPDYDQRRFLQNLVHLNITPEQLSLLGVNPVTSGMAALYQSAKLAKDLFIPIQKFVTDQPEPFFPGQNGQVIYENPDSLGYEFQKSIFSLGMMLLPMGGPEVAELSSSPRAYSVAFETDLNPAAYIADRKAHFQEANEALLTAMEGDGQFANMMRQIGIKVERTETGKAPRVSPENWSWHHSVEPGVMQLVPRVQHTAGSMFWDLLHPWGIGGYFIWGTP